MKLVWMLNWRTTYIWWSAVPSSLYYKLHQIPTLKRFSYCLVAIFAESLEARCQVENEDVVGAAPIGDAPTTSEWSTILLPTKVRLVLRGFMVNLPWLIHFSLHANRLSGVKRLQLQIIWTCQVGACWDRVSKCSVVLSWQGQFLLKIITRPTLERRATLGHLRSIKPNMINHFAN